MTAVMDENKCVYMCKCVRSYQEQEHDKIKTSISHLNAFKYVILFTSSDQSAYELVKCALSMLVITIMHLQYLVDLNIMQHKGNKLVHYPFFYLEERNHLIPLFHILIISVTQQIVLCLL